MTTKTNADAAAAIVAGRAADARLRAERHAAAATATGRPGWATVLEVADAAADAAAEALRAERLAEALAEAHYPEHHADAAALSAEHARAAARRAEAAIGDARRAARNAS